MAGSAAVAETWPTSGLVQRVRDIVAGMAQVGSDEVRFAVSPYRICPLGAHIDHQGGCVTAMAINKGVLLGFVPSESSKMQLRSGQYKGQVNFSVHEVHDRNPCNNKESGILEDDCEESGWGDYARGAVVALQRSGFNVAQGIIGFVEGHKGCDGGGISSSAAIGIAMLLALEDVNSLDVSEEENIELDRLIENSYLGLRNGLLDQSAILLSQRNCLTVINCKDRSHMVVHSPWSEQKGQQELPYKFVLAFSGLRHALASKPGYNLRVTECQAAADALLRAAGKTSTLPVLGDVTIEQYKTHEVRFIRRNQMEAWVSTIPAIDYNLVAASFQSVLESDLAKRARHYFTETSRVEAGIKAWKAGDLLEFGKLMTESGLSSIENYECGCEPLVQLREIVLNAPGVLGARFSGAGFRGCCVGLVAAHLAEAAAAFIRDMYKKAQPELAAHLEDDTAVLICESANKAHIRSAA